MRKKSVVKSFSLYHVKFIVRIILLILAIIDFVKSDCKSDIIHDNEKLFTVIWVIFMVEMFIKLFPVKIESIGNQKQFGRNYLPKAEGYSKLRIPYLRRASFIATVWIGVNTVIGALYYLNIVNTGMMVILFLIYAVGDMVCVIFFCPFQQLMRNRCCTTCRIYNWDYMMMFTPLVFVKNARTASLVILALIILIRWEYAVHLHTERFSEKTNLNLSCKNCPETHCTRRGKIIVPDVLGKGKEIVKETLKK